MQRLFGVDAGGKNGEMSERVFLWKSKLMTTTLTESDKQRPASSPALLTQMIPKRSLRLQPGLVMT